MTYCKHLLARPGTTCSKCGTEIPLPEEKSPPEEKIVLPSEEKAVLSSEEKSLVPLPTLAMADAAARILERRACRKFSEFCKRAWYKIPHLSDTKLEWSWHHDAICTHLQTMIEEWYIAKDRGAEADKLQRIRNLAINIAPGSGKTLIVMVLFPSWVWTRFPRWTVRCVSSNPRSILESSDFSRQLVTSDWYVDLFIPKDGKEKWAIENGIEPWAVRDDKNAVSDWGNTLGGSRRSTGLSAAVTGEHTDWILADDPHDAEQVNSEEMRTGVIAKWDNAIFNRVNDRRTACRVLVMQRLRHDDLSGHIIERDRAAKVHIWALLIIASEFEADNSFETPYGWRDPRFDPDFYAKCGGLLDPVRFSKDGPGGLNDELNRLTTRGYAAQHQQRPDSDDAVNFKISWWSWYSITGATVPKTWERPEGSKTDATYELKKNADNSLDLDWVCVSVDASGGSIEDGASAVGILIVGGKGMERRFVLDDCTPGPRGFNDQLEDVKKAVEKAVRISGKRSIRLLVEKKAYGGAVLEQIEKQIKSNDFGEVDGKRIAVHFEAYEVKQAMGSKEQRGLGLEPDLFAGYIHIPEGAAWLVPFLAEFKRFPSAPNDRVDALVQCIEKYRKRITWAQAFRKVGK